MFEDLKAFARDFAEKVCSIRHMRWWPKAVKQAISKHHVFFAYDNCLNFSRIFVKNVKKSILTTLLRFRADVVVDTWWKMCENAMEKKETKTNGSKIIQLYTFIFFAFAHANPILLHPNSIHTQCSLTKREKKTHLSKFLSFSLIFTQ